MAKVEPDANPEMQRGMAFPVQVNGRLPATGQLGHAKPASSASPPEKLVEAAKPASSTSPPVKLLAAANPSPASSASPPDPQKPTAAHPAAAPFHCPLQAPLAADPKANPTLKPQHEAAAGDVPAAVAAAAAAAAVAGQKEMPATPIKASTAGDVPMATPQAAQPTPQSTPIRSPLYKKSRPMQVSPKALVFEAAVAQPTNSGQVPVLWVWAS